MVAKVAPAKLNAAPPMPADEAALLEHVAASRPSGWFSRFKQGAAMAFKVVTIDEFNRVCATVAKELDGMALTGDEAAKKATRLIEAYTLAHAGVICPKCDISEQAVLVAWLGSPRSGFLFQRAIRLKDPKGVKRG